MGRDLQKKKNRSGKQPIRQPQRKKKLLNPLGNSIIAKNWYAKLTSQPSNHPLLRCGNANVIFLCFKQEQERNTLPKLPPPRPRRPLKGSHRRHRALPLRSHPPPRSPHLHILLPRPIRRLPTPAPAQDTSSDPIHRRRRDQRGESREGRHR